LTNIYGKEKFSLLQCKNKMAEEKNLVQSGKFSSATLILEGRALIFSPKKIVK
jgi:hypothetical protein